MKGQSFSGFFILTLICCSAFGQNAYDRQAPIFYKRADSLYNLDNPNEDTDQKALELYKKIEPFVNQLPPESRVNCFLQPANIHQSYRRFTEANVLYHKSLEELKKMPPNEGLYYEVYLYLGSSLYLNGIIDSARFYFEKASDIATKNGGNNNLPEKNRLYNSLGAIYYEAANYRQAINYFETALANTPKSSEDYEELFISARSNIAISLLKQHYYDSSIRIFKSLVNVGNPSEIIYQNLAHAYVENGKYDSALAIYQHLNIKNRMQRVLAMNDKGRIFMAKGQWKNAEESFQSAISESKKITGLPHNKMRAISCLYSSELAEKQGKTQEAINWSNRALQEIHFSFHLKSEYDLPDDVSNTLSPVTFYQILFKKAALLYTQYKKEKNIEILQASLSTYLKAIEALNYMLHSFDNDDAKVFIIETSKTLYNETMMVAYDCLEKKVLQLSVINFIIESYKGNVLLQKFESNEIRRKKTIPANLLNTERELKGAYTVYLTKLNQTTSEKEEREIRTKIAGIQVKLSRIQIMMEKFDDNAWQSQNHNSKINGLKLMQQKLDNNTSILNYYIGVNYIYLLAVNKSQSELIRFPVNEGFLKKFSSFNKEIYQISDGKRYAGNVLSKQLYDVLIKPVESLINKSESLVIIPDEYLFYLPFDALIQSDKQNDYLLNHYDISYHYAASLLFSKQVAEQGIQGRNKSDSIEMFAPFAGTDAAGIRLPFSADEVIGDKTIRYLDSQATKSRFLQSYFRYRFIHLATHANLSSDSSNNWIRFYPEPNTTVSGKLFIHEIYNLDMQGTDLVTLSACETGGGMSVSGEGLLSLSRAFIYAGAKGIVSTLYKTDDQVNAFIMKRMYFYLNKGDDIPKALRQAKIDFIESEEVNSRLKSPNYWANFIYVGKIQQSQTTFLKKYYPVLMLAGFLITGYFLTRRYLQKTKL